MFPKLLAEYLEGKGLGTFDEDGNAGDIFIDTLPEEPDECISLFSSISPQADSKLGYDFPVIQVITRANHPLTAFSRGRDVYNALHGLTKADFGGVHVVSCIARQSSPQSLGKDDNRRAEYSLSYEFDVRNNSEHRE